MSLTHFCGIIILSLAVSIIHTEADRVLELSDRFLELRGDSPWLIMFYAPWCGHCKKLEPVWNLVSQALAVSEIRVGRVDCTRFTSLASEFSIRGFPTIMFVHGDIRHIYYGDRVKDDIVNYAFRMAGPVIQHLPSYGHLQDTIGKGNVFFIYVGLQEGHLWEMYVLFAEYHRSLHFFYSTDDSVMQMHTELESNPAVMVFKDGLHYFFPVSDFDTSNNMTSLNDTLADWINNERFPSYIKVTHGNINQLWKIKKLLAIAVVQENKIGKITLHENEENFIDGQQFMDMFEMVVKKNREKYHKDFQFGWTGSPDLANSIAMERLALPSLLVVNASSMLHYMPQDPSEHLTPEAIEVFFDSVLDQTALVYGGDSYPVRTYRLYYNARMSLEDMWLGNPILTSVMFGLPLGFLSLICYSIWCADILDANDEEEEVHAKNE